MAITKIVITFNVDLADGEYVEFNIFNMTNPASKSLLKETFSSDPSPRRERYIIPIQTPTGTPGEESAIQYLLFFNLDHAKGVKWFVNRVVNVVTIEYNGDAILGCTNGFSDFATNADVDGVITNCDFSSLTLTEVLHSEATNACNNVQISIETSEVAPNIFLNDTEIETSNAANPYLVDIARGVQTRFKLIAAGGDFIFHPGRLEAAILFPFVSESDITVKIKSTQNGATLTASVAQSRVANPLLIFTYSINDSDYFASPVFTGQLDGVGTMYVLDQFGCKTSKEYEVTSAGTRDPYLSISRANPITFSEYEVWDGYAIHKNDSNLLAHQSIEDVVFCEELLWRTQDETKIHFHSNYDNITVDLRDEDGTTLYSQTVVQLSANLNRFYALDGWYYKYKEGLLGLYFLSGDTYDDLGIPIGTFNLNGNLPDFAIKGAFVDIEGIGLLEIIDVVFDPVISKKIIVVSYTYSGVPVAAKMESIFDLLPFEVYEVEIDWSIEGNGLYDVLITNADTIHDTVQHLSENISIKDDHPSTVAMLYYNENNRDIFYKYGMKNFIRVQYTRIVGKPLDETELNINDLTTTVTDSSTHEIDTFYFDAISKNVMRKLVIALGMEHIFINGVGYAKHGNLEVENVEHTNSYTVSVDLIKTGINFNNNRQGQLGLEEGTTEFDIPPFIWDGTNYIKA